MCTGAQKTKTTCREAGKYDDEMQGDKEAEYTDEEWFKLFGIGRDEELLTYEEYHEGEEKEGERYN